MQSKLLDATVHAAAWNEALAGLPLAMQDVYYTPAYLALHALENNSKPRCFVFTDGNREWIYPFILRSFGEIGCQKVGFEFHDIESVYGYGGPLTNCRDMAFLAEAHFSFKEWCSSNRVIAEFVRLHPMLANEHYMDPATEIVLDRETRSLTLTDLDPETPPFDNQTKYMLRRAEKLGMKVECVSDEDSFRNFVALYTKTMDRLGAESYYYFNDAYFLALGDLCCRSGFVLAAIRDGQWMAAALFLSGRTFLHYHLSATDPNHQAPGVMNLLLWQAAKIGHTRGLARLHLGGGRSREAGDSLLRFKTSMSSDAHQFFIGKRIHDLETYKTVRDLWAAQYPDLVARFGKEVLCYHRQR